MHHSALMVSQHVLDGTDEIACRVRDEHVTAHPDRQDLANHRIRIVHCEHHDFCPGDALHNLLGCFQTVENRHPDKH